MEVLADKSFETITQKCMNFYRSSVEMGPCELANSIMQSEDVPIHHFAHHYLAYEDKQPRTAKIFFVSGALKEMNSSTIEEQFSAEYNEAKRQADDIREALLSIHSEGRERVAAANAPKVARTCPFCGATTFPDESGRCEYCGGAMGV